MRVAYPEVPEEFVHQVSSFIDGVKYVELRQSLHLSRNKELNDAIIYILEYEAIKRVFQQLQNMKQRDSDKENNAVTEKI